MSIISVLIQLIILIVAMVAAGLIMRWILANPEKFKSALSRIKKYAVNPSIHLKAFQAYRNWKKVGMEFSYGECLTKEWEQYDKGQNPDQPYYRL